MSRTHTVYAPLPHGNISEITLPKQTSMSTECPHESLTKFCCALEYVRRTLMDINESEISNNGSFLGSSFAGSLDAVAVQEKSLISQIVIAALELKDFNLAITVIKYLLRTLNNDTQILFKPALHALMGRIYLQFGDLQGGEKCLRVAHGPFQSLRSLVDEGILAFAQGMFQKAYETFHRASLNKPYDLGIRNNCAVCLLYLGRLKEAIFILTDAVNEMSERNLQAYLNLNLNTLRSLESGNNCAKETQQCLGLNRLLDESTVLL